MYRTDTLTLAFWQLFECFTTNHAQNLEVK